MERVKFIAAAFLVSLLCSFVSFSNAHALDPISLPCRSFRSSQEFVKQATLHCLTKEKRESCLSEAESRFKSCRYRGNFQKTSRLMQTKILLLMVLSGSKGAGTLADG